MAKKPKEEPRKLTLDEQLRILRKKANEMEKEDLEWWDSLSLIEQRMPKVELHAHLSGSLPLRTIIELLEFHRDSYYEIQANYEDLIKYKKGLEVFRVFPMIHKLLDRPETIRIAMLGMIKSFAEEGCVYLEVRTTPKETIYMQVDDYLRACLGAIEIAKKKFPTIKVFLVVSFDIARTTEDASYVLRIVGELQRETNLIVGIDICGNPMNDTRHLIPIAIMARQFHGLGVTVHLGELPEMILEAQEFLKFVPDRIGHGTFLMNKPNFVRYITEHKIPFEICLSSNEACGTVRDMKNTHGNFWRQQGNPIAICTDDQGILPKCSIMREYKRAMESMNLTMGDMVKINRDAMDMSFAKLLNVTDLTQIYKYINLNYVLSFENVKNPSEMTILRKAREYNPQCLPSQAIHTVAIGLRREEQCRLSIERKLDHLNELLRRKALEEKDRNNSVATDETEGTSSPEASN